MIELACPSCGRAGSIPREKLNTRLNCKKCHVVFHVTTGGRAILGEPHVDPPKPEHHALEGLHLPALPSLDSFDGLTSGLGGLSPRSIGIGALVLAVVGGLFMFLTRPPESLADRAKRTAERFADDDLAYLKQVATSETIDDVVRWFDAVHPQLVKSREHWKSPEANIQVMVIGEDRQQRRGEAQAFIYPGGATSRVTAIAAAADSTTSAASAAAAPAPIDLRLHWVLDRSGTWKLDGLQTFHAVANAL